MADRATALAGGLSRAWRRSRATSWPSSRTTAPKFLETIFAANYLGAIAMPINWRLAAPEVRYILEHSGARALVCDEALVDLADEATRGMEARARPGLRRAEPHADGWTTLADLQRDAERRATRARRRPTTSTGSCTRRAPPAGPRAS